ncbi:MAG: hypothetical protein HY560_10875 [Gemmatimonadetes bacterium]|nr:hypothetical protein [Gemmatimonadota bacterium]
MTGPPRLEHVVLVAAMLFPGCTRAWRSIAPADLAPVPDSTVERWVGRYSLHRPARYDLRWRFQNDRGAASGRAAVRVAPPDSLRLDFRGPFGKSGAAVVVGDSGLWAKPAGDFHDVLAAAPLFWAALALPLKPADGATVFGAEHPDRRSWRYALARDTFDFIDVRASPARLLAEMRRAGRIIGRSEARFDPAGQRLISARMDFPAAESRFTITVEAVDTTETFEPGVWRQP